MQQNNVRYFQCFIIISCLRYEKTGVTNKLQNNRLCNLKYYINYNLHIMVLFLLLLLLMSFIWKAAKVSSAWQ